MRSKFICFYYFNTKMRTAWGTVAEPPNVVLKTFGIIVDSVSAPECKRAHRTEVCIRGIIYNYILLQQLWRERRK